MTHRTGSADIHTPAQTSTEQVQRQSATDTESEGEGHLEVSGSVQDEEGHPVEGVGVWAVFTDARATTDSDGRFRLDVPTDDEVTLLLTRDGYRRTQRTVELRGSRLELRSPLVLQREPNVSDGGVLRLAQFEEVRADLEAHALHDRSDLLRHLRAGAGTPTEPSTGDERLDEVQRTARENTVELMLGWFTDDGTTPDSPLDLVVFVPAWDHRTDYDEGRFLFCTDRGEEHIQGRGGRGYYDHPGQRLYIRVTETTAVDGSERIFVRYPWDKVIRTLVHELQHYADAGPRDTGSLEGTNLEAAFIVFRREYNGTIVAGQDPRDDMTMPMPSPLVRENVYHRYIYDVLWSYTVPGEDQFLAELFIGEDDFRDECMAYATSFVERSRNPINSPRLDSLWRFILENWPEDELLFAWEERQRPTDELESRLGELSELERQVLIDQRDNSSSPWAMPLGRMIDEERAAFWETVASGGGG